MKRGKIVILVGAAVTFVAIVVAAVVMFRGLSGAAGTRAARDEARRKLESFYGRKPFPTAENVDLERTNLETVTEWSQRLLADLQASNISVTENQPSAFSSRREAVTAELVAKAPTGEGGARVVPADFGFGFDAYKGGQLADPADVPRLIRQLRMVELLVREAYASGVLRIASVSRDQFEANLAGGGAPAEGEDRGGGRRGRRGGDEPSASPAARGSRVEGAVPMSVERFSMELTLNEVALVELLNRFARLPIFAVVTRVDFAKSGPDYVLAPSVEAETAARAPGQTAVANPMPPTRTARLVSGRNREAPLKVSLDIEVYSFEGEEV